MPRQPRIEAQGLLYHIIARGIERRKIFRDKADYRFFLDRLGEILSDTETDCLAFSLLPNHFHLLLRSNIAPISTVMRRLLTGYAVVFNKRHRRVGHLFQNRYKSIICQAEPYLLELIRYIHLNPIRAKIVFDIEELGSYAYSSHSALVGKAKLPWYTPEIVLTQFGKDERSAKRRYLNFLNDAMSSGRDPKYAGGGLKRSLGFPKTYPKARQAFDERILGDSNFVLALQEHEEKTPLRVDEGEMADLLNVVADCYDLTPRQIIGKNGVSGLNEARCVFAYLALTRYGRSFAEIARYLNVHRSNAARMADRGKGVPLNPKIKSRLNV